jgi:hypothetical protein
MVNGGRVNAIRVNRAPVEALWRQIGPASNRPGVKCARVESRSRQIAVPLNRRRVEALGRQIGRALNRCGVETPGRQVDRGRGAPEPRWLSGSWSAVDGPLRSPKGGDGRRPSGGRVRPGRSVDLLCAPHPGRAQGLQATRPVDDRAAPARMTAQPLNVSAQTPHYGAPGHVCRRARGPRRSRACSGVSDFVTRPGHDRREL